MLSRTVLLFVCFLLFLLQVLSPWNKGSAEETNPLQLWACLFVGPLAFRARQEHLQNGFYLHFLSFFIQNRESNLGLAVLGKSSATELHPRPLIQIFQNLTHAHVFWNVFFFCFLFLYVTKQDSKSLASDENPFFLRKVKQTHLDIISFTQWHTVHIKGLVSYKSLDKGSLLARCVQFPFCELLLDCCRQVRPLQIPLESPPAKELA